MILQNIGAAAREAALVTCERLLSGVFENVHFEILRLSETIITLLTPVQCLAGYYHIKYGHLLNDNYKWGVKLIPARNLISTPCIRAVTS